MSASSLHILFSGGGTVGHLAPGFALAGALEAQGAACVFATPGEAVETAWFHGRPAPLRIPARRLPRGVRTGVSFPLHLLKGVRSARRLLRSERIDCVVGLGGWPCAPAVLAARWTRTPLAFLVPDAVPGALVRRFARWADRLYLANPAARSALEPHPGLHVSGPLLRGFVRDAQRAPQRFGLEEDRLTLLVTGGSLGARGLNRRVLEGLACALEARPELREQIQVIHSAGADAEEVRSRYRLLALPHHVAPYIEDMGTAYRSADLVLARAGASTCAELATLGVPAIFVPYPHHADRQQFLNAAPLVERGAARLIEEEDLSPESVRAHVVDLLLDTEARAAMRSAGEGRQSDAAAVVAADLIRFLGEGRSPTSARPQPGATPEPEPVPQPKEVS